MVLIAKRVPLAKTIAWVGIFFISLALIAIITGAGIDLSRKLERENNSLYRDLNPEEFIKFVRDHLIIGFSALFISRFRLVPIENRIVKLAKKCLHSKAATADLGVWGYVLTGLSIAAFLTLGYFLLKDT